MSAQLVDSFGQPVAVLRDSQIGTDRDGVLVAAEFGTQLLQPVFPAGSDDDAVTAGHELTGEFFADA
ncbi:hypothetical protein MNVI_24540 [Mycobacterium noviomagense]|uniref:Uncharacterized protein n=1 Tax=Mycobacterium noviomagense TaxID=459858 RepID=A0A7I7PEZ3_9MYCO|nr:hypothetical protein MNVI_24540 [Mycobacterium noviomagense]